VDQLSKEDAEREYLIRFKEWKGADEEYERIGKQYFWSGPIVDGQPIPSPTKVLDIQGFKELEEASNALDKAKESFDKASKNLYQAYRK
jgi:hypothetical protein